MTIRHGKPGDLVYLHNGRGPQVQIVSKHVFMKLPKRVRGVYYRCKFLEPWDIYSKGDIRDERAKNLSRKPIERD